MKRVAAVSLAILMLAVMFVLTVPVTAENTGVFENEVDVAHAQSILVEIGFLETGSYESGALDHATHKALTEYQLEHSLNDHGELDDDTFQMLLSHEMAYPWGMKAPVAIVQATPPAPAPPETSRAVAPKPAPPVAPPAPVPAPAVEEMDKEVVREMPRTASSLPLLALFGILLMASGLLVLRTRRA
jgi:LPXTG-motif cell wall-anchored protein